MGTFFIISENNLYLRDYNSREKLKNMYGDWPKSGEVDILEAVGFSPDSAFGSVHTQRYNGMFGTQRSASLIVPNLSTQFHNYEIVWTPEKIDERAEVLLEDILKYYPY